MEILNVFNALTLKKKFWKTKTFFKNVEHRFIVESTKIENASFPYKTTVSEANVKTNRIVSAKWAYHKEWSFCQELLQFFWKFCFSLRTSYNELCWCTNDPNIHIHTFCKRWNFIWGWFFPASILNVLWNVSGMNKSRVLFRSSQVLFDSEEYYLHKLNRQK